MLVDFLQFLYSMTSLSLFISLLIIIYRYKIKLLENTHVNIWLILILIISYKMVHGELIFAICIYDYYV